MSDYAALKKKMSDLRKEMETAAKDFFKTASKTLFDENPKLESFGWSQYTPYFNDGDTCEFSANTDYEAVSVNGMSQWGEEWPEDEKEAKEIEKLSKVVSKFLNQFEDDDFEKMFGDHVEVTVTRKGVKTEGHDHE